MPTLRDFHQQRRDRAADREAAARQALQDALAARSLADDTHAQALAAIAHAAEAMEATRRAMAEAPLPADAEALAETLRGQIVAYRQARRDQLDAEQGKAAAEAGHESAVAESKEAAAALAEAELELAAATERGERVDGWVAALGADPLAALPTDAGTAQTTTEFQEAEDRTVGAGAEIPGGLRTRSLARRTLEQGLLTEAETALGGAAAALEAQAAADGGVAGALPALWRAYEELEAQLGSWVRDSQLLYDRALLQVEAARSAPVLTAEQAAQLTDGDLQADRDSAISAEADRDTEREAVETARRALEAATLAALAADVDLSDTDLATAVATEQTALTNAESDLSAAEDALDQPPAAPLRGILDLWEAAVPEHTWQALGDFVEAREALQTLAAGPGTLAADLASAEDALATALIAHDRSDRTGRFLADTVEARTGELERARTFSRRRIASAVRGDR